MRSIQATKLVAVALLVGALGAAPDVLAQTSDTSEVDRLYLEGVMLYKAGRYKSAISRFREAYDLYPDPKLLYNIARCHESRGDLERALKVYRKCLLHEQAGSSLKKKANRRIELVEQVQERSESALTEPPANASTPARSTPRRTQLPAEQTQPAAAAPRPAPRRESLRALTVAKWGVGAAGLGLVAGGITAILLGVSDQNKINDAIDAVGPGETVQMRRVEALQLQDDADSKKAIGYALVGIGAAAVVGSALMFYFDGWRRDESADTQAHGGVQWTLSSVRGGGTLGLTGAF
jgi:tetratricopeptide (TPR) repeat protein